MPLTDEGFEPFSLAELRDMLRTTYETESGETPDWDEDTFFGAFSEAAIFVLRELSLGQQQLWDAGHIDNSTGRLLDVKGIERGVLRREATASRAVVAVTGTAGRVIPAGKVVECTANQTRWEFIENVTIPDAAAIVECLTLGAVPAPSGTLTEIVTPVDGWSTVTNAAAATLGDAREDDATYRSRLLRTQSARSLRTAPALIAAVEALDFITTALVVNNTTPEDTTVGAFTVPAHGHLLIVEPSTLTADEEEELAETIFYTLGYGTQQGGDVSATTTFRGTAYTSSWAYATSTDVAVTVTLTLADGYVFADVAAEVETAIATYFAGLTIGDAVRLLGIYGAIDSVEGVVAATVLIEGVAADFTIAATAVAAYDSAGSSYSEA